jgi:Lrp/AsnC family leucine-responsive transcriptional regulator
MKNHIRKGIDELGNILFTEDFSTLIDPDAIGRELTALIFVIVEHPEQRANLLAKIDELPEILECHHVIGDADYILKVRCDSTRDLERLVNKKINSLPSIKTMTKVILSKIKPVNLEKE